jgi:hypothetical protein
MWSANARAAALVDFPFQRRDNAGSRWLRKAELAGGAREVTGARDAHEKPQRRQAIAHQESPIHSAHKYMLVLLAIYSANRQRGRFASAHVGAQTMGR